jgi:cytochrome c-type biogenesis protein CcmH/NrfG
MDVDRASSRAGPAWGPALVALALGVLVIVGAVALLPGVGGGSAPAGDAVTAADGAATDGAATDGAATGAATDGAATDGAATAGADEPTTAELEAHLAETPDDVVARLVLAHRHFDDSAYDAALEHYLEVLGRQPGNARALARAGWIAYEGGDDALAVDLLERSLAAAPGDAEALWFLGQVHLGGTGDAAAAAAALAELAHRDDLSDGFRGEVRRLLAEARAAGG